MERPAGLIRAVDVPSHWLGGARGVLIRAAFLLLAVLCLFGGAGAALDRAFAPVHEHNDAYLKKSLTHAAGWMAGIMAVRMGVSAVESVSVEPMGVGMEVGRVVEPVSDALSDLMDLMTINALLIVFQLAVLEVIRAVSLKYLVGLGALLCAVQFSRLTAVGRLGLGLISIGLVVYVVYPLALSAAAGVFEEHNAGTYIEFTESVGVLKERSSDIYAGLYDAGLSAGKLKALAAEFRDVFYEGLSALWRGMWGLMTSFAIMFVLSPLMAAGASYLLIRQIFAGLDMAGTAQAMGEGIEKALGYAGKRTRAALRDEGTVE